MSLRILGYCVVALTFVFGLYTATSGLWIAVETADKLTGVVTAGVGIVVMTWSVMAQATMVQNND